MLKNQEQTTSLKYHLKDSIKRKEVELCFLPSAFNLADLRHHELVADLGMSAQA